ncbi:LacI family transcriptional regulator [Sporanaerobium hydrogeniformans]|uniref:LacI family transcriptional regulator n=1 Tax=Sporanaerobium hydrogeniformans TaxID=3072179 RepID=A0AC61D861_9FIRM|nr:substrate-binding domain-containing protein [Sporanaerobium hydrogeniformans]PHV69408.1 LacI family transcriptional regulator [Sporanaerobium hydrogeniformans]
MKRKHGIWFLIGICICTLGGCGSMNSYHTEEEKVREEKLVIGLSVDSFVIERWQRERDIFISKVQELGAEVNVQNANGDIDEQIAQIEYLIDKKVQVITVIPVDSRALTDVIKKAKSKGIKVIAYDRLIKDANVDLYISFDNKKVGELMAQNLVQTVPENGNVLMICGPLTDHNVLLMEEGFESVITKSNLNIIDKHYVEQWIPERAFAITNKYLQLSYKIDGIMGGNDAVAGQAIKALAERRLAGKVSVVGQDADVEACQRIVEGTQSMTVYKQVDELAKRAAEYAVKFAKGENVEILDTIFDGSFVVPYEKLEPIAVTKENMQEVIIDGGFHSQEDVYLNIPIK